MNYLTLKSNNKIPKFGIGTWGMGEKDKTREKEMRENIELAIKEAEKKFAGVRKLFWE